MKWIGAHEVRGRLEVEHLGGFVDATGRQIVSLAGRQLGGAMADAPGNSVGQQTGQFAVDRRVRLAEDACQLC